MNPAALEIRHADTDTAADANQKGKPRFLVKVMRIDSRIREWDRQRERESECDGSFLTSERILRRLLVEDTSESFQRERDILFCRMGFRNFVDAIYTCSLKRRVK